MHSADLASRGFSDNRRSARIASWQRRQVASHLPQRWMRTSRCFPGSAVSRPPASDKPGQCPAPDVPKIGTCASASLHTIADDASVVVGHLRTISRVMNRRDFLLFRTEGRTKTVEVSCERLYMLYVDTRNTPEPQAADEHDGEPPARFELRTARQLLTNIARDLREADMSRHAHRMARRRGIQARGARARRHGARPRRPGRNRLTARGVVLKRNMSHQTWNQKLRKVCLTRP